MRKDHLLNTPGWSEANSSPEEKLTQEEKDAILNRDLKSIHLSVIADIFSFAYTKRMGYCDPSRMPLCGRELIDKEYQVNQVPLAPSRLKKVRV